MLVTGGFRVNAALEKSKNKCADTIYNIINNPSPYHPIAATA
jgi:hypothetical protein